MVGSKGSYFVKSSHRKSWKSIGVQRAKKSASCLVTVFPFFAFSLGTSVKAFADDVITIEYSTEVSFSAVPVEADKTDDLVVRSSIIERDLEAEITPQAVAEDAANTQNNIHSVVSEEILQKPVEQIVLKEASGKTVLGVFNDSVPSEVLERSRANYRRMFGDAVVYTDIADPRFVGSLNKTSGANEAIFSDESLDDEFADDGRVVADNEALSSEKMYTVRNGKIVEVSGEVSQRPQPARKVVGNGWVVAAADEPSSPVSNEQSLEPVAQKTNPLLPASASQENSSATTSDLNGRLLLPKGVLANNVVVRIAGTGWQVSPDSEGFFSFQEIPRGAKLKLLVWDVDGVLVRRMVPVSAVGTQTNVEVEMVRTSEIDLVATAFGVRQSVKQNGFCGQLVASSQASLVGAKVTLNSPNAAGPFFYDANHYPSASLREATEDGRFCVFNNELRNVSVQVHLVNGARREFTVSLEPGVFEPSIAFDVESASYRPVQALELVDGSEVIAATQNNTELGLGMGAGKTWITGQDSPMWARITEYLFRPNNAYAAVHAMAETKEQVEYLPAGQEHVELGWHSTQAGPRGFQLFAREDILPGVSEVGNANSLVVRDDKSQLQIRMLDPEVTQQLDAVASSEGIDSSLGIAFVNLNVAALGLEYSDVKMALKNPWSGETVSKFQFIPLPQGVRSPKYIRGFFANLPLGDYTLVVSSKDGVLKWLDVVRSKSGEIHVVSIRD